MRYVPFGCFSTLYVVPVALPILILTRERRNQVVPEQAVYRVTLTVDNESGALAGQSWRGNVTIRGAWQAPAWPYIRNGLSVLLRETGF